MNKDFSRTIADLSECDGVEIVGQDKVVAAAAQGTAIVSAHEHGSLQWSLDDGDEVPATDPEQHFASTRLLSKSRDANAWAKNVLQSVVDVPWTELYVAVWMVEDASIR